MEESIQGELESACKIYDIVVEFLVNYSFQVLGAIIILLLGWMLARWLSGMVVRFCTNKEADVTLAKFIGSSVYILILACFVIIALGKFGISVTPLSLLLVL